MHRGVRGVGDPGLLVDHRKPPTGVARAHDMIEPRHRAIVDIKGETLFGQVSQRQTDRGLDGAAMRHRDDVLARMRCCDALDYATHAVIAVSYTHLTLPTI